MAKTYEVVVYDDGAGVTSSITEYDRDDNGVQTYVGRSFLDADQTGAILGMVGDREFLHDVMDMLRAAGAAR